MSNSKRTHVVVGAGGAISRALVPELIRYGQRIICVSRSGTQIPGSETVRADARDYEELSDAVPEGSAVYLLVGVAYDVRVWKEQWPKIMDNTIRVCREKQALLVFFDNAYMYGKVDGVMTEQTPHNPGGEKGEIRARIADQLIEEYSSGRVQGLIARSADFYGPGAEKSGIANLLILERMLADKTPQWIAEADTLHSLTYTSDCGRALPLLVFDRAAHNQLWHLPTARPAITARHFAEIAAKETGSNPGLSVLSGWRMVLGGLVDRTTKELVELLHQNRNDYVFDSTKFETHFSFQPTPYGQGVMETVHYYRQVIA